MSVKGTLTRKQAVALVGLTAVLAVEAENCDFTNRLQTDGDDRVEFCATVNARDTQDNEVRLTAYYYQTKQAIAAVEQLDELDWTVEGFEVITL